MKNLTIKSALVFLYVFMATIVAQAQGSIEGVITDVNNGERLEFVNVVLKVGDIIIKGVHTNSEGYFAMENIAPGKYTLEIINLTAVQSTDIIVGSQDISLNIEFDKTNEIPPVDVTDYRVPLIPKEDITTYDAGIIQETKVRNAIDIVQYSPATVRTDEGLSFKGSRPGTAVYYIDGIRTYGELYMPMSAVDKIEVYIDGIPAKYGNTTAGVIVVETKSFIDFY